MQSGSKGPAVPYHLPGSEIRGKQRRCGASALPAGPEAGAQALIYEIDGAITVEVSANTIDRGRQLIHLVTVDSVNRRTDAAGAIARRDHEEIRGVCL